jgi:site-specific DNA-methyltransferase (adenine-specific)
MIEIGKVHQGDCLELMKRIDDGSVDMILCDLPYGTTACKWDVIIPFEPLWEQYKRIIKPRGAIVLTASQPFTSKLVMSNIEWFKYSMVWCKSQSTGHLNAWKMPMRAHEDVLVFCRSCPTYNPELKDKPIKNIRPVSARTKGSDNYGSHRLDSHRCPPDKTMPNSLLQFNNAQGVVHPTQKPVALFEYLIKTYTQPGELVLDNCAGSGTTGVACLRTGRRFILMEQEAKYCEVAEKRIQEDMYD